jgi:hypothetical protein
MGVSNKKDYIHNNQSIKNSRVNRGLKHLMCDTNTNKANTGKACDLCGLTVETPGFTLKTREGDKAFCCEGCKGIYHLLNDDLILSEAGQE